MNDEFKTQNYGKKLSEIAQARVIEFMKNGARADVIQKAELFVKGAILAEELLEKNDAGAANVHFMGAIIAGIMSSIPPAILTAHFEDMVSDAIELRRIHEPEFDKFLTNTTQIIILSEDEGKVH